MCGRLNVIDDMFVQALLEDLRVNNSNEMLYSRFKMPTNDISIVRETEDGERQLQTATWWLLQQTTYDGFKPSHFTSFNTRSDKLNHPNSAGFTPFRESRCIVIAKGFGETEKKGSSSVYHDFVAENAAVAFGGLYREWQHPKTGESRVSCSIITNPPHLDLLPYHSKASPMILPEDSSIMDAWLSPENQQVDMFSALLKPALRHDFIVEQIDKPSQYKPIGKPSRLTPNDFLAAQSGIKV
ncbi:SOS response-associated peptidase [Shewanella gelidimarina]|uniref:SOS response-associated peptidase family protein n=1 Tax=Shewanella gelidimarina TaxID=56813 RepID=UPI00200E696A|nr:SOS response-associated peptidase family protein [Shewanella gelidimarina]MCL1058445.1 SOS response-associated peptidase [Shewanella gelidimarina]